MADANFPDFQIGILNRELSRMQLTDDEKAKQYRQQLSALDREVGKQKVWSRSEDTVRNFADPFTHGVFLEKHLINIFSY